MVVFEVLSGDKGDRMRLFLTDAGYRKFQGRQEKGEIKIEDHMKVTPDGHLHHDHNRDSDRSFNVGVKVWKQLDIQGKLKPVERRLGTLKKHIEQADIYFKYKGKKPLTEAE